MVKIHCEGAAPSFSLPWQVDEQSSWSGSGFVITESLVLTNAHVDCSVVAGTTEQR